MVQPKFALVILDFVPGKTAWSSQVVCITNALANDGHTRELTKNAWLLSLPKSWNTLCALVSAAGDLPHHVALLEEDPFLKTS